MLARLNFEIRLMEAAEQAHYNATHPNAATTTSTPTTTTTSTTTPTDAEMETIDDNNTTTTTTTTTSTTTDETPTHDQESTETTETSTENDAIGNPGDQATTFSAPECNSNDNNDHCSFTDNNKDPS